MSDVLIRDLPDDVVAALDVLASRLGISRTEYIRRRLAQDARSARTTVSVDDLKRFGEDFGGLGDAEVMSGAWE